MGLVEGEVAEIILHRYLPLQQISRPRVLVGLGATGAAITPSKTLGPSLTQKHSSCGRPKRGTHPKQMILLLLMKRTGRVDRLTLPSFLPHFA